MLYLKGQITCKSYEKLAFCNGQYCEWYYMVAKEPQCYITIKYNTYHFEMY